jgi:hypothetical protein
LEVQQHYKENKTKKCFQAYPFLEQYFKNAKGVIVDSVFGGGLGIKRE